MKNKKMIGLSLGIVIILITTTATSSMDFLINDVSIYPTLNPDPYPQLDAYKKVWNATSGSWDDEITVVQGTIVRFNISIIYHDLYLDDNCYKASYITIVDYLTDFEYIGNPTCSEPMVPNPDNYLVIDPMTNIYTWDFGNNVNLAEAISGFDNVMYLEFDAKANQIGTLVNQVHVSAIEKCCDIYCEDNAEVIVNVIEPPRPDIELHKYVKHLGQWAGWTEANVGDPVEFKILITNTGNDIIHSLLVKDDLPNFLTYNNDANHTPSLATDHHIEWDFISLDIGETIEIIFSAHVDSVGNDCNIANVTTYEGPTDEDTACVEVTEEPPGDLECEKKVWDPDTQTWEDEITAEIGDTVRFKITFTYHGTLTFYDIHVKDTLPPCLEYADNANPTETDIDNNIIWWNLSISLSNGESYSIEFDALVISDGTNVNVVNITGIECGIRELYCEAEATVIVEEPLGDLECEKKVWDPDTQTWEDEIYAEVGDTVRFNITVTYIGINTVHSLKIKDILPPCLEYANNADPTETDIDNNIIWWNLSITLLPGESYSIEFDSLVISDGTNVNVVNVNGEECPPETLYCEDTATVIVECSPSDLICEKKVWDPDTQTWEDEITAEIGDTVRFKITFSYWGDLSFYNIWVLDTLPPCLEYADNAIPFEPAIDGNELLWHLIISLDYGESYSVEFDALVISGGDNVNVVNINGIECGIRELFCEAEATVIVGEEPDELIADANGPYSGETDEVIGLSGSATGGVEPYTYEWDFDYNGVTFNVDATGKTTTNSWSSEGFYTVALRVTDNVGTKDIDTTSASIEIPNDPPLRPGIPEGPTEGKIETDYTFLGSTTDPDGDQIWYKWSWGDGNESNWLGPYNSGVTCDATYQWAEEDTFQVKVKAKDSSGEESAWSLPLEIGIKVKAKSIVFLNDFIQRLLEKFPILEKIISIISAAFTSLQNIQ